jgi:hypothetical protein
MKFIEECDAAVSTEREQFWYDIKMPLFNKCRPGQTKQEGMRKYRQTDAAKKANVERNKRYRLKKKAA